MTQDAYIEIFFTLNNGHTPDDIVNGRFTISRSHLLVSLLNLSEHEYAYGLLNDNGIATYNVNQPVRSTREKVQVRCFKCNATQ